MLNFATGDPGSNPEVASPPARRRRRVKRVFFTNLYLNTEFFGIAWPLDKIPMMTFFVGVSYSKISKVLFRKKLNLKTK